MSALDKPLVVPHRWLRCPCCHLPPFGEMISDPLPIHQTSTSIESSSRKTGSLCLSCAVLLKDEGYCLAVPGQASDHREELLDV